MEWITCSVRPWRMDSGGEGLCAVDVCWAKIAASRLATKTIPIRNVFVFINNSRFIINLRRFCRRKTKKQGKKGKRIASPGIKPRSKAFSDRFVGANRRNRCFPAAFGRITVNRSRPWPRDSLVAWKASSGNGRQFPPSRSAVSSIWNSSSGTRNTNRTPPSGRVSAKINRLCLVLFSADALAVDSVESPPPTA